MKRQIIVLITTFSVILLAAGLFSTELVAEGDVPSLQATYDMQGGSSSGLGGSVWLFVVASSLIVLGFFIWLFKLIFSPTKRRKSTYRKKLEKQRQNKHDNQSSLQEAVDDD